MAGRPGAPGPVGRPGVARTETGFRGVSTCHGRDKLEVGPEFPTSNRPSNANTTRGVRCGEQRSPGKPSHVPPGGWNERDSPSCTGVGVEKLGREGRRFRVVTPELRQYPSSAAGFRRRALFFEKPPDAKSERQRLLRSFRVRPLEPLNSAQAPTSPGPWERAIETTMPTGLAVARGQFRRPGQGPVEPKQVPHGPSSLGGSCDFHHKCRSVRTTG